MRTVTEKSIILPFFRKIGNCILPNAKTITLVVGFFLLFLFNQQVSFGQTTRTLTFTSPGTWTVPAGVTEITVEAWGAGGAGGGSTSNSAGGGSGGGGGGYCINVFTVTPGQTINYTVGAGGTGSNGNGTPGDTTLILSLQANGGGGGGANMGTIGSGGTASGGTTNITGGSGLKGKRNTGGNGGTGASGGAGGNGVSNEDGEPGTAPGGGGGGGEAYYHWVRGRGWRTDSKSGGNGANGQIKITYTSSLPDGFWYKADAGTNTTTNGSEVTSWTDQSFSGNNASSQRTAPIYTTSGWNFNPKITFKNGYFLTSNNNIITGDMTFYVVFNSVQTDSDPSFWNNPAIIGGENSGQQDFQLAMHGGKLFFKGTYGNNFGAETSDTYNSGSPYIVAVTRKKSSSGSIYLYVNGTQRASASSDDNFLSDNQQLGIGNSYYYSSDAQFVGGVSEVIGNSFVSSLAGRGTYESYLAIKYGISLPGNYYASDGTTTWASTSGYQNDIHGIGRDDNYGLNQLSSKSENPGTDILTIQSGNSFVTPTNAQTGAALTNKQFFITGHNNGSTSTVSTLSAGINTIARKWYAQTTNMLPTESFQFNLSGTNFGAYCKIGVLIADNAALTTNRRFVEGMLSSSTLTVNDLAITGNKYFTVATLADTEAPVANCKSDLTVYLDANGEAAITPEMLDNGSTDDCGIDTMWVSPEVLSCNGLDSNIYSKQITSSDGYTVTVNLFNLAVDVTTACPATWYNYQIAYDYSIQFSGSNIPSALYTSQISLDCDNSEWGNLSLIAGSGSGKTAVATRNMSDCASVSFGDLNCSSINLIINGPGIPNQAMPMDELSAVTLNVQDYSGNTNYCQTTVTVLDTIKPTINCPASVTDEVDVGFDYATNVDLGELAATDTTDNCTIESVTNNAPLQFPLGNTDVVWTVTDVSGNTATCTQLVTIIARDTVDMWVEQPGPTCNAAEGTINSSGIDTTTVVTFNVKMETNKTTWSPDWEIKFTLAPSNNTNPGDVPTINTVASVGNVGNLSVSGGLYTLTNIPSTNGKGVVSISMNLVGNRYANLDVDFIITEAKEIDSNIQDKDSDDWQAIQTVNAIPNTGPITTN